MNTNYLKITVSAILSPFIFCTCISCSTNNDDINADTRRVVNRHISIGNNLATYSVTLTEPLFRVNNIDCYPLTFVDLDISDDIIYCLSSRYKVINKYSVNTRRFFGQIKLDNTKVESDRLRKLSVTTDDNIAIIGDDYIHVYSSGNVESRVNNLNIRAAK